MGIPDKLTPGQAVCMRLDELRREHDISLHRIAKRTGVSYSTVKSYGQNAAKDITLGNLIRLANFFGMTLSEFTDSEYFDRIDVTSLNKGNKADVEEGLRDFMELRNKSEEWIFCNNSHWWYLP